MHLSLQLDKQFIGKQVTVTVDRQMGTKHPKHDFVYPINYGFIKGVTAPDGEDLDAYLPTVTHPIDTFTGICIAIVHRRDDDDDKLVVIAPGETILDEEIMRKVQFQEQWFDSVVVRS